MEYLLQAVPTDEPIEVTAVRLSINFELRTFLLAVTSSSIFITHPLFEIALLSQEDVESIRTEVEREPWNLKVAGLNKFYRLDSALCEIGRFYGPMHGLFTECPICPNNF